MRRYNTASTFVAPEAPQAEYDPVIEHLLTQNLERDVLVPLLQNVAGGLGLFVAIVAVQMWRIDFGNSKATVERIMLEAVYWSGGAFGVVCAIRAFKDEIQMFIHRWGRGWAEGYSTERIEALENENDRLNQEIRELSIANAQMVRNVRVTTGVDELPKAPPRLPQDEYAEPLRDALALCRFQDAHGKISRDVVIQSGAMDRTRWEAAKRLLEHSGVPVANGIIGSSAVEAMGKVREFVARQRQMPEGFVAPSAR